MLSIGRHNSEFYTFVSHELAHYWKSTYIETYKMYILQSLVLREAAQTPPKIYTPLFLDIVSM